MASIDTLSGGPLTPTQYQELAIANQRATKILKAAKVAAFNGWMLGIFAALSAPFAMFSISGVLVTAGLAGISYQEFQGRRRLLKFDPAAATALGWNQIALVALTVAYCGWMLVEGLTSAGPFAAEVKANPQLGIALDSLGEYDHLYKQLVVLMYGSVLVVSLIFQGCNAYYYFTRRPLIQTYVRETPPWIVELQRLTALN